MLELVLFLNILWFAAGFHLFSFRGFIFAKIVVPREHRGTPVMETLITSGKFFGGFNFAFALLNIVLLLNTELFDKPMQWSLLLITISVAHGSQFFANVPVFLQNQRGEGIWHVKGLMLFIFVIDFSLMVANALLAALI